MEKAKITTFQFISLLFVSGIIKTVIYIPYENDTGLKLMLSVAISTLIQILLIIPVSILATRYPDDNILEVISYKSKFLSSIVAILYFLVFIISSAFLLSKFCYYTSKAFSTFVNLYILAAGIILASMYCAFLGAKALSRSSVITLALLLIFTVAISLLVIGKYRLINLTPIPKSEMSDIPSMVIRDLSGNIEIIVLPMIYTMVGNKTFKSTTGALGLKFITTEYLILICTLILGPFAKLVGLPIFLLGSYAKTGIIERFDSIFFLFLRFVPSQEYHFTLYQQSNV